MEHMGNMAYGHINPFPTAVEYSTSAVYARDKYFCFLHKCCCQPITNIIALDLDIIHVSGLDLI